MGEGVRIRREPWHQKKKRACSNPANAPTMAWSMYIMLLHSSCMGLLPCTSASQQASTRPSGVGQHVPELMPSAMQLLLAEQACFSGETAAGRR